MYTESNGISITQMCYQCQALTELCPDCQELRDSRDITIAHQIVDDGNLQYKFVWSIITDEPSGHDWISSQVVTREYVDDETGELVKIIRDEFTEPISQLADRIYDLDTSLIITPAETICQACHLVYNKATHCPNCN
jgi:hypothetical protein